MHNYCTPTSEDEARRILMIAKAEWLGDFGESIWRNVLESSGWNYISLAKICEGGAPMMHSSGVKTILPDFDACRDGRSAYVEAKAKTQSIYYGLKS